MCLCASINEKMIRRRREKRKGEGRKEGSNKGWKRENKIRVSNRIKWRGKRNRNTETRK